MPVNEYRLVVGYRDDDPRRYALAGTIRGGEPAGKCLDCNHEVYLDLGALKTVRDRDCKVACMFCQERVRDVDRAHPSGLIGQL